MFKQLLPKAYRIPELTFYELKQVSYDTARSHLITLPVTDRTMGIEVVLNEKGLRSLFFIEYYQTDLSLLKTTQDIIYPKYNSTDCFTLYSDKASIFPFSTSPNNYWNLDLILEQDEEIRIQLLFVKRTSEKLSDEMWTQYEDYVNGVEEPTNIKAFRAIQQGIIELARKVDGVYKRNVRIPEVEGKLREDIFKLEARYYILSESERRRTVLNSAVKSVFMKHSHINHWTFGRDTNKRKFLENFQFRRFSLLGANTYLSSSELASFFVTTGEGELNSLVPPEVIREVEFEPNTIRTSVTEPDEEFKKNPFSIFSKGHKKHRENDIHFATKLNKALRKLSLINEEDIIIQKIQHGVTVQRIIFTLPEGLKLTNLTRATADLQTELALNNIAFEQGERAGTVALSIPQDEREAVYVGDLVEDESFKKFVKEADLPLLFGQGTLGDVVFTCLTHIKHLLICGSSGSGKSVFLNAILTVLLALVDPRNLQVIMIDPKMVELSPYKNYPHTMDVFTDMNEVEGVLAYVCEVMDERYKLFQSKGNYKNIQQYNRNESNKLPYILVVIEELADLMSTNSENEQYIVRLAQKARAAGLHLILATQYPVRDVITSLIKRNIVSRACFALDSGTAYKVAMDEIPSYSLLGRGDGIYKMEGKAGIHRFQSPLIGKNEEDQDRIISKVATYWSLTNKKVAIDTQAAKRKKQEKELNELKRIILITGETRVTELYKQLEVRTERVSEMLDALVNLGWLKKHKSRQKGYELILSDTDKTKLLEELKNAD